VVRSNQYADAFEANEIDMDLSPTRQPLQPEAIGAVMEATKCLHDDAGAGTDLRSRIVIRGEISSIHFRPRRVFPRPRV
jgi:hypothetical protein